MRSSSAPTPRRAVFRGRAGLVVVLLVAAVMFLALAVWLTFIALPTGQKNSLTWGQFAAIAALLFAPLGALGALMLALAAPYLGARVEVDEDGVEARRWYGATSLAWGDLRQFWWNGDSTYISGPTSGAAGFTLVGRGGRRLRLRNDFLTDGLMLGHALEEYATRAVMPLAEEAMRDGEDVEFGPLTLTPRGVARGGDVLPWAEVAEVQLSDGGRVVVRKRDRSVWFGVRMSRVPNLAVLLKLAGQRLVQEGLADAEREADREPSPPSTRWGESSLAADEVAELGTPLLACEPTRAAKEAFAGAVVCFVLAGLVAAVVSYGVFVGKWFNSPSLPPHIVLILVGVFAAGLAVGGFAMLGQARKGGYSAFVYDEGLVRVDKGRAWVCPWGRVVKVWQEVIRTTESGQYAGTTYKFVVERDDGENVTVSDEVKHADKFGEEVQKRTYDRLLRRAVEAFRAGEDVDFGQLQLTPKGVREGKKLYPWSRLKRAELRNGFLYLLTEGGNLTSCAGWDVANLAVLLAVIEQEAPGR